MNKIFIKKVLPLSLVTLLALQVIYFVSEPTISSAVTASDNVIVTLNVTSGITISNGADTTMTPNLGVTSDQAVGSSSWIVKTNNAAGYTLSVKASTSPALADGVVDSFADYTEAVAGTPDVWGGVAAGTKEFGFSAYGADTNTTTWGTSASCGNTSTGVPAAAQKYKGFSLTDFQIATRNVVTPNAGITTNICFAAQQNAVYASSGIYTATVIATAATL